MAGDTNAEAMKSAMKRIRTAIAIDFLRKTTY